ncbi:MAG: aromatic ring-hydroxylating dioxygenase subunit alpha [Spirulinaceae cyanobacterium]
MKLAPTLQSQNVQNRVREIGINPNYWYPVAWSHELKATEIFRAVIWQQGIAVYRDDQGKVHALEDACPHKGVALHNGAVHGNNLVCPYHGWEFAEDGKCVKIPYLPPEQKLPCAQARSYPTLDKYGIIWVFPGEASLAAQSQPPEVPEYSDPQLIAIPIPAHFQAHFSICNENTMDVFHGFLHQDIQGWFDPVLLNLQQSSGEVEADYQISYRGFLSKILGLSNQANQVTTKNISIRYRYPHYYSSLEGVSSMYLMRLPVGPQETRSFSLLFLKLPLPQWLIAKFKPLLSKFIWRFLLKKFLLQDIAMIESEQKNYLANPQRKYVEINPAIIALQRLIIRQYEKFVQQSSQSSPNLNGNSNDSVSLN